MPPNTNNAEKYLVIYAHGTGDSIRKNPYPVNQYCCAYDVEQVSFKGKGRGLFYRSNEFVRDRVYESLDNAIKNGYKAENIFLLGLSRGAYAAATAAQKFEETYKDQSLGAVIMISPVRSALSALTLGMLHGNLYDITKIKIQKSEVLIFQNENDGFLQKSDRKKIEDAFKNNKNVSISITEGEKAKHCKMPDHFYFMLNEIIKEKTKNNKNSGNSVENHCPPPETKLCVNLKQTPGSSSFLMRSTTNKILPLNR